MSKITRYAFNRGLISPRALHRLDLKRSALAAETQTNWMPEVLGPMSLRAGTRYLDSTNANGVARMLPFVFSTSDTALLECTNVGLRVWLSDAVITRPAVLTAVTNGTFDSNVTGWTDADESGATSAWATGGYLSLTGSSSNYAIRDQEVAVALADRNVEHGLRIQVIRGSLTLYVGVTQGDGNYTGTMLLRPGWHSIAFTPTGATFWIRLASVGVVPTLVSSCTVEAAGAMVLTAPWATAYLPNLRYDQSGDVVFVAYGNGRQQRIERQGTRSWSLVDYLVPDGPFLGLNTDPITLTASALSGTATLTASKAVFNSSHVGALFKLDSSDQTVTKTITAADQWSNSIRVTGVGGDRAVAITVSALTGTHTVSLQRSVGAEGSWTDVTGQSWTADVSTSYTDGLDNQIIYYRIGCKTGGYTSGGSTATLYHASGSISGIGRVTAYTSQTVVSVDILQDFGSTSATDDWYEGRWSSAQGWPSAVALYDGRLWWAGKDSLNGSVSDAYASFSSDVEGDSGTITRTIGSGPVDTISWLLPLSQLLVGGEGAERMVRASSLDEPLTPTACSLKPISTQGSARVSPVVIDTSGVFVERSRSRVYELSMNQTGYSYDSKELTAIVPEIGGTGGFEHMAVQRKPDTRIHCVRADGKVAVLVYDRVEEVTGWVLVETDGEIEDVVVLPSTVEDAVYYVVLRTINGTPVRYLERFALASEMTGEATTVLTDSSLVFVGPLTTVTGLTHLAGESVAVWGNGKDLGTYTVTAGGEITLTESATSITVGLPYTATFVSARLALTAEPLTQRARLATIGLTLYDTHPQGLQYGQSLDRLDELPLREQYADVDQDTVRATYVEDTIPVGGSWSTDARLCLVAASPRPCTVAAAVIDAGANEK